MAASKQLGQNLLRRESFMRRRKSGLARQLMGHAGGELGPKPDDPNSLFRANVVEGEHQLPYVMCVHTQSHQIRKEKKI